MSIKAVAWALDVKCSDPIAKLILITLAEAENAETGECWPSVDLLAERAECSRRSVFNKLNYLVDQGYIETRSRSADNGRQTTNSYRLLQHGEDVSGVHEIHPTRVHEVHAGGEQGCTGEGAQCCTPIINRKKEPEKEKNTKKENTRSILESVLSPEIADGVIQHRIAIRKKLTELAAKRLAAKFAKWPDPDEAAATMVERGWQGFELEWMKQAQPQTEKSGRDILLAQALGGVQ